jgi:hypothetical protein
MASKPVNPLLSKNIPKPPPQAPAEAQPQAENGITVPGRNGKTVPAHQGPDAEVPVADAEKATVELSLYLKPSQDDKLEDLKREYKKRTRKKISSNQIMRKLIDQATIEDLLA